MIHFFLAVVALTLRRKLISSIPVSYIQFLLSGDYPQGGRMIYVKLTWVSLDAALLMVSSLFVIHPSWIVWHNCTFDHITAAYEFSFVVDKNYIILWQSGSLAKNPILLYTKPPTPLWGKFGSEYVTPSFNPGVLLYIYVGAWPLWWQQWENISDLKEQGLSHEEIYNVWCDRLANQAQSNGDPTMPDPSVSPAEKWALYTNHPTDHKIIGNLSSVVPESLAYPDTLTFICNKHNLTAHSIHLVNTLALGKYLGTLKVFERASTVKLIHGWAPSLSTLCRQGRAPSSLCPRCHTTVEVPDHVIKCPQSDAIGKWLHLLNSTIESLCQANTLTLLLNTFQYKLSLLLDLPHPVFDRSPSITTLPNCLITAIQHQNLLGWNLMLGGFTSKFWL